MKKSELQHLDIIVTRDRECRYYFEEAQKIIGSKGFSHLSEYDENLNQVHLPGMSDFDIMEVHRMEEPELHTFDGGYMMVVCSTKLIWKRGVRRDLPSSLFMKFAEWWNSVRGGSIAIEKVIMIIAQDRGRLTLGVISRGGKDYQLRIDMNGLEEFWEWLESKQ